MEIVNSRDEQMKLLTDANAYFDKLGLTLRLNVFFSSEAVQLILHEAYSSFKTEAEQIVSNLPLVAQKRGKEIFKDATGHEDVFIEDAKNSFICTITARIISVNDLVVIDDIIGDRLHHAFINDFDKKLLRFVFEIANGLKDVMLDNFKYEVSIPAGVPDEIGKVLFSISGGRPMMSLAEIEAYRDENPSDSVKSEEVFLKPRLYHPKKYH